MSTHGARRNRGGGWQEFGRVEQDRVLACVVCGTPLGAGKIDRLYCSKACDNRADRERGHKKAIDGGGRTSYSTIATGRNEQGALWTVIGWGKLRSDAKRHATAQLEAEGFAPICFSTPDSILRDLQRTA